MSTVKLTADSGGGTVALAGPSTTTGNAAVTLTLPQNDGDADQVLTTNGSGVTSWAAASSAVKEQFFTPCDGSTISTSAGDITVGNVTAEQSGTSSYAQVTGSSISYTPPSGTTQVIYEYSFSFGYVDAWNIGHFRLSIGGIEVSDARSTYAGRENLIGRFSIKWGFNIGGSTTAATGRQATWTSAKTIMLEYRDYSSSYNAKIHHNNYWDGTTGGVVKPCVGITAIGGTA